MIRRSQLAIGAAVAVLAAACASPGTTTAPAATTGTAPTTAAATTAPAASEAASPAAADATIVATEVGDAGTIIVDGATGLTLYYFTKDVKDSGESVCTGDCLATWPALTVAAGETPTGGDGVTGTIGTITRADDSSTQVTYNGLPLYFFKNDKAAGDLNGVYENWITVAP
jgi:predicted lipoprotein with Yx(FWY)xxD motif